MRNGLRKRIFRQCQKPLEKNASRLNNGTVGLQPFETIGFQKTLVKHAQRMLDDSQLGEFVKRDEIFVAVDGHSDLPYPTTFTRIE